MNIGLVANVRGKLCLVHDESFEDTPLWVAYHIDKRQVEIVFEGGGTYPIDWEATDDIDEYLMRINKILMIRMENKKPVEGYDTFFYRLRAGRIVEVLSVHDGLVGDDRHGPLVLRADDLECGGPPIATVYDGLSRILWVHWQDGRRERIPLRPRDHESLLMHSAVRVVRSALTGANFDAWLPITISMKGEPAANEDLAAVLDLEGGESAINAAFKRVRQEEWDNGTKEPPNGLRRITGAVEWFNAAKGYGFLAVGTSQPVFIHESEVKKSGLTLQPDQLVDFEIRESPGGKWFAVNVRASELAPEADSSIATPCPEWDDPALWTPCSEDFQARFAAALNTSEIRAPFTYTSQALEAARLPFYDGVYLVKVQNRNRPPPNAWFCLWRPGQSLLEMNWTNERLRWANEHFGLIVNARTARSYARFFFHFVHGKLGRFRVVRDVGELPWLPDASEAQRSSVASRLQALHWISAPSRPRVAILRGTVLFKNALFDTHIMIARAACSVFAPDTEQPEDFSVGQTKLFDERLLLENLSVESDGPPDPIYG